MSDQLCEKLDNQFRDLNLYRPQKIDRYNDGSMLTYDITSVENSSKKAKISLEIKKFVGGGFAGQVYRVSISEFQGDPIAGLEKGKEYALKILIPPSHFSLLFRNILYGIGFQGAFQLQTNPAAARSGALWQKFIRRAARVHFGDESCVNNIHATFVDETLGSCGEISDWVEGRTWRLEVDDHINFLSQWERGKKVPEALLGSPEYRSKKVFMQSFVKMLIAIGAHEFARQYEWSTWKSQPNCLKRKDTEQTPEKGLMAVDFRAGLALLPFLPMSPGDILLIFKGLFRGSLVQFDRGNLKKLKQFMEAHPDQFTDMQDMYDELVAAEDNYRNSIPDITHNHLRLLYSPKLWKTMRNSTVTGWKVRSVIDSNAEIQLRKNILFYFLFLWVGIIPFLGKAIRKFSGNKPWRKHYLSILSKISYLGKALQGKLIESAISWYRTGRISAQRAERLPRSPLLFLVHLPLSLLPAGIHRFLTSWTFMKERLDDMFRRPIRLYFNAELREQWMRDMVADGQKKHIITDDDAETILSRLNEPFIQKYLKSLAVHVCTAPITQVVSVAIAGIYLLTHPEVPRAQAYAVAGGIIALFQVVPLSPGSLTRGLYVLYLVIRERNFKDYNIAVFLGFFKYIGYLAFPIQMTTKYPTLARFMAGYWATEAVHIVPVFGENGALLEHKVYCLFYNWPLTIRRRMVERKQRREKLPTRYWHTALYSAVAITILGSIDYYSQATTGAVFHFSGKLEIMAAAAAFSFIFGSLITIGAGGAALWKRVLAGVIWGVITGAGYAAARTWIDTTTEFSFVNTLLSMPWRIFALTVFSAISVVVTEVLLPERTTKAA